MSTVPPVTLLSPDDAYNAFKGAEGTYTVAQAQQASADAALTQATAAKATADQQANTAAASVKDAADTLIASLQAYESGLVPPA